MDPVTLIFLVVAIIVALKLYSTLGRRGDGDDRGPMEGYGPSQKKNARSKQEEARQDNVVTLPTSGSRPEQESGYGGDYTEGYEQETKKQINMADLIGKYAASGSPLEKGLTSIAESDKEFSPDSFLDGAKTAYEMIVMAFAEGNRKLLKQLLAKEVYEGFSQAIDAREKQQLIVDSSFIGIDKASFVNAELTGGRTARITMKFVSSLITATHNRDGDVIDGDPKKVREVTDIWTFSRDMSSRDPNWQLVATEAAS